jgi:hypothetical protein
VKHLALDEALEARKGLNGRAPRKWCAISRRKESGDAGRAYIDH